MSEAVLRILLELVDKLSGPAQGATGSLDALETKAGHAEGALGNVEGAADDAGKGLADVEEGAEDAGKGLEKTTESASDAQEMLQKFITVGAIMGIARKAVQLFQESIQNLAAAGDQDAQRLVLAAEGVQTAWARAAETVSVKLAPAVADYLEGLNILMTGQTSEQAAQDAATKATREHIQAVIDQAKYTQDLATVIYQMPMKDHAKDIGLLGERAGEVYGRVRDNTTAFGEWASALARASYEAGILGQEILDVHLATLDGQWAISEYQRRLEEAFAEGITEQNIGNLVQGLSDAAIKAEELGTKLPQSELENLQTQSGKLREALAGLSLTDAERAVLLQYLDLVNGRLSVILDTATRATGAIPGGGVPGGSAGMGGGSGGNIIEQSGGAVTEPSGGGTIVVQLVVDGRVLAEAVAAYTARGRGV